jgi:hypothetical protein
MSSETLTDVRGRPLHGAALANAQAAEERRQAEREALAAYQAVARGLVLAAARLTGLPGPDALRALFAPLGAEGAVSALTVLRVAGHDAGAQAAAWRAQRPASQSRTAAMWASSPDHDPRVMEAVARGATDAEISAVRAQVAAEYADRAAERQARSQRSVMWRTRSGEAVADGSGAMGVSLDDYGAPHQRSLVHRDVPELGSEPA